MIKENIITEIKAAIARAGYNVPESFALQSPPKRELGDFATNIALLITQQQPELIARTVAEAIIAELKKSPLVMSADVAGPGFINIKLNPSIYLNELSRILEEKNKYGSSGIGEGKKIQVEHVSANPTGPLHIGNARGGPIGESLAALHAFLGYTVEREFYVNDIGGQVDRFAESLYYWYAIKADSRIEFPEGGYKGDYIKEISETIQAEKAGEIAKLKEKPELLEFFKKEGLYHTVKGIKEDCELIDVSFDKWAYQSDIQFSGKSDNIIKELESKGATINREGALWFKNPAENDFSDKEDVLRKSDEKKTLTYFADDIAYHMDKHERGFVKVIDVWGSNHHGHVARLKGALDYLGVPADWLHIILYQYVRLKNAGQVLRMAKREGSFVTLREVIESGVAADAFKYFILAQNPNTPFDFDLQLAKDTSEKNPVYYIKYAHARIASILRKAKESGVEPGNNAELSLLATEKEANLYRELVKFPEIVEQIREDYQIQALPHYVYKVATLFHDFYTNCHVLTEDKPLTDARLALVTATKYVIANALGILGINAPEKM